MNEIQQHAVDEFRYGMQGYRPLRKPTLSRRAYAWACAHPNLVASLVSAAFGAGMAAAFLYSLCNNY